MATLTLGGNTGAQSSDGLPDPFAGVDPSAIKRKFRVRCILCLQEGASLSTTKHGGFFLHCGRCNCQLIARSVEACALLRGQLAVLADEPTRREWAEAVLAHAPLDD